MIRADGRTEYWLINSDVRSTYSYKPDVGRETGDERVLTRSGIFPGGAASSRGIGRVGVGGVPRGAETGWTVVGWDLVNIFVVLGGENDGRRGGAEVRSDERTDKSDQSSHRLRNGALSSGSCRQFWRSRGAWWWWWWWVCLASSWWRSTLWVLIGGLLISLSIITSGKPRHIHSFISPFILKEGKWMEKLRK